MKYVIVLCTALLSMGVISPAEATRPVPGYNYKDVCKNIPGDQYIFQTVGTGRYRFNYSTKRPNDCYVVWRRVLTKY